MSSRAVSLAAAPDESTLAAEYQNQRALEKEREDPNRRRGWRRSAGHLPTDLTDLRFGHLVALELLPKSNNGPFCQMWHLSSEHHDTCGKKGPDFCKNMGVGCHTRNPPGAPPGLGLLSDTRISIVVSYRSVGERNYAESLRIVAISWGRNRPTMSGISLAAYRLECDR